MELPNFSYIYIYIYHTHTHVTWPNIISSYFQMKIKINKNLSSPPSFVELGVEDIFFVIFFFHDMEVRVMFDT